MTGGNQLLLSTVLGGTVIAKMIRKRNAEGVPVADFSWSCIYSRAHDCLW